MALLSSGGLVLLALTQGRDVVVIAAATYGLGSGAVMSLLYLAIHRCNPHGHSNNAALWATSLDSGGVLGCAALAGLASVAGYQAILWLMPATSAGAALILWRTLARSPSAAPGSDISTPDRQPSVAPPST